ncbi:MAG: tetratricopeptide repeat protein, partial [bacterium]|nr:tetratricopeptide repeat protein [bacterium]
MANIKEINKKIESFKHKGEIQKAIEYCQSVLLQEPSNPELNIRLGDLYMDWHLDVYQAKQYIDEAIMQYQKACENLVDNGEIYYKIGFAFFHKGELDRALNYFEMALKNNGDKAQCYFMIANCYKKKERYADALDEADKALKSAFLNTSRIHYLKHRLIRIAFFSGKNAKWKSMYELFMSYLTLPFDKEAKKDVVKKFKIFSIAKELYLAARATRSNRYLDAVKYYSQAIDKMPGFTTLYCLLGDIYRILGKHEEAIIEYKMARWIDSLYLPAYVGLVQAYEEMGEYESAIETYQKFITIHPNNPILHSQIANLYFMKGEHNKAVSHYQSAILLNPKHEKAPEIAQTLGFLLQHFIENDEAAVLAFLTAYALDTSNLEIYVGLGAAFYEKEDYANALKVYRRAIELQPNNAKIHCNLGFLLWGLGNLTEAISEYE